MIIIILLSLIKCEEFSAKVKALSLPTWSLGYQEISDSSEITPEEVDKAYQTFLYPLNPDCKIIISSRFSTLEEQFNHFIFGAALAFALNRSIILEMRNYPLDKEQPVFHFDFKGLNPGLHDPVSFKRLRVARELFCKDESYFQTDSPSIPILVRNYDDISTLYGNHYVGGRLRSLFGKHAVYFLAHYFLSLKTSPDSSVKEDKKNIIGIDARYFPNVHRMKELKDPKSIAAKITAALTQIDPKKESDIFLVSNNDDVIELLKKSLWNVKVAENENSGFFELIRCKTFVGTYRSKYSQAVNMARGVPGFLVNTHTGDVINMSTSQACVLQPYIQDVEDAEFTVNEKLRGCVDNIDDLRDVLDTFVL